MRTMPQYLDLLYAACSVSSDYALAKRLSCSRGRMSNYRTGETQFDNTMCLKVAEILGMNPLEVIADMEVIRAQAPEKKALWQNVLQKVRHVAVWSFLAIGATLVSGIKSEVYAANFNQKDYTLCEVPEEPDSQARTPATPSQVVETAGMSELKQLRREACTNIGSMYKIVTSKRTQENLVEQLARMLHRSMRTVLRWERAPEHDPLVEYAYRYLAGHVFGWQGWQINLRHNEVRLHHSALSYTSIPRQRIEGIDYGDQLQQQLIRTLQKKIEGLEAELESVKASRPRPVLASFLRKFTRTPEPISVAQEAPSLVMPRRDPEAPGATKILKTVNENWED